MHWADKIAKQIISSGKYKPYLVDDMKTPSGFAHVGSLRGPLIHSVIYRALKNAGVKVKFTFVFNDFDPADDLPPEFRVKLKQYMGFPLRKIPSPVKKFNSLAELLVDDLRSVISELGVEAEYLSSWDMYQKGMFDEVIKVALNNSDKIQNIYQDISGSKKRKIGWLPLQVICEKCGRISTTRVYKWDGKKVQYKCEPKLVSWAKGCGHEGSISPFKGNGKLPWKVDWPAHWKVMGVTVEGAGKDHASAGGSYDIAMEMCDKVFGLPRPFKLPYEFFLIGGRKMSSSRGLGIKAHDITKFLPAEVARFLFTKTKYQRQIDFNPEGNMTIPDLFDEYDECWQAYIKGNDKKLARTFELSQIGKVPPKEEVFLPRFRDVANYISHAEKNIVKKFEEIKGEKLIQKEKKLLEQRIKYVKVWLEEYAPENFNLQMSKSLPSRARKLSKQQREFLKKVIEVVEKESVAQRIQTSLYNLAKKSKIDIKDAFAAIYIAFIGKKFGPRAGQFLLQYPKEKVIKRLKDASK